VGMAVDANILTFERIKEELRAGKSVMAAYRAGARSSLRTIIDANITTLLAASILFIFGTSSVKGFATMLIVSIVISFVTAVYGTRLLLGLWINSGYLRDKKSWFGVKEEDIQDLAEEAKDPTLFKRNINFVKHRKKLFVFSTITVVVGIILIAIFKINPGVDFTSGSRIEIVSDQTLSTEEVEQDLNHLGLEAETIVLSGSNNERAVTRYDTVLSEEKEIEVNEYFLEQYGQEPSISIVSSIVGQELVKNAFYALGIASLGMIL